MPHGTVTPDGSFAFDGGVDSQAVTTIASSLTVNGLQRNQLAWLINATVRGGAILQRTGWQPNCKVSDPIGLVQGGWLYQPIDDSAPYFIVSIKGHILKVIPDTGVVTDLSVKFNLFNAANIDQAYLCQAEEFLIIQSGDAVTLPLFWDNATLRRSKGITNPAVAPGTPGVNEIPVATAMDYFMNRLWYAQGRSYGAGDICKGPSGTVAYGKRDSILNITENPLCVGGDNFTLPTNAGNIRALKHTANLDSTLGQGQLQIFTRKAVYAMDVPVTRADWTAATSNNGPRQTVSLLVNGSVNDRSVVASNGDLFFQSVEPAIRSLFTARRDFGMWGNVPISRNVDRVLRFNDRNLLRFASGIQFDNRVWQTALPVKQASGQVVHEAVVPLDFDVISTLQKKLPPAWEGVYAGLDIIQLFVGDFGGRERAFAIAVSRVDGSIELWELTTTSRTENGDNRVEWVIEFPALTWGEEFELKELMAAEFWVDKESGEVLLQLDYRPDADPCWKLWGVTEFCTARSCAEDMTNPVCYPVGPTYREGYCFPITFGNPPGPCAPDSCNKRHSNVGHQFQVRLTIKGWCRIRGFMLYAARRDKALYDKLSCLKAGDLLTPQLV